jgi:ABC-type polysaccharide/polyol phosphate transport system ATPase subunit
MDKDIAIQVNNISKTFRIPHEKISSLRGAFVNLFHSNGCEEFKALDNVSFDVKKGEFFGIIGRNGSGKSTLLKILAGIYQPDKGGVKVDGLISPFLELGIGFNPELSGRDNVYLNAAVLGLSHKQIDEKFDDIVEFSELRRFIDQKVKNYSSGMQVRLMFSVAIHVNREILLMDEVLAVGDTNFQSKCLQEFNKYRDQGKTVVLVTHDIGAVQRYCDRAMLLRNGKIEIIGDPEEVGNKYVYQNMSDEEKRIVDEEKIREKKIGRQIERKKEKKIAEITKVEFIDENGDKKNVFRTGDDILVRVYFKQKNKGEELNFGLAIFNQEGDYLIGINTFLDKKNTELYIKNGYFEVLYPKNCFAKNKYYTKVGIWGLKKENLIDFLSKSDAISIYSNSLNDGIIEVDYRWV